MHICSTECNSDHRTLSCNCVAKKEKCPKSQAHCKKKSSKFPQLTKPTGQSVTFLLIFFKIYYKFGKKLQVSLLVICVKSIDGMLPFTK